MVSLERGSETKCEGQGDNLFSKSVVKRAVGETEQTHHTFLHSSYPTKSSLLSSSHSPIIHVTVLKWLLNLLDQQSHVGEGGNSVQSSLSRAMQAVMRKATRQVQQVAPLNANEDRIEKTGKTDRNHADKGRPFELIWT